MQQMCTRHWESSKDFCHYIITFEEGSKTIENFTHSWWEILMKSMSGLASLFPAPVAIQSTTACRFDVHFQPTRDEIL